MTRPGIFGWSYPPGCSGPPDEPDEPYALSCPQCGGLVGREPTRVVYFEDAEAFWSGYVLFYTCFTCGLETSMPEEEY